MYPKVVLKAGRDRAVSSGHPWVFSGAVKQAERPGEAGYVTVVGEGGHFLGQGFYNPSSDIRVRMVSRVSGQPLDDGFWAGRVAQAVALRQTTLDRRQTDCWRWINGEGDLMPGLVVDRYGEVLVVQHHTLGAQMAAKSVLPALMKALKPKAVVERSDLEVRRLEGLEPLPPRLIEGSLPDETLRVEENGLRFLVRPLSGQKTGLFLDQRDNRARVRAFAQGKRVLNCHAYTGGFSLAAMAGGASQVVSVEISPQPLQELEANWAANGFDPALHQSFCQDAFLYLEEAADKGEKFDLIVLDPPAFVKQMAAKARGLKGYLRLNRLAMRLLPPGGLLLTASCSTHVSPTDWEETLRQATRLEKVEMQLLAQHTHGVDHPINLMCPEGRYLKSLFLRRMA